MKNKTDREIAEAATPGPWKCVKVNEYYYIQPLGKHRMGQRRKQNAEFHAHFNPAKVLAMLDLIEEIAYCGNCHWNTDSIVHGHCDPLIWNNWAIDRERGSCDNWKMRG